MKALGNRMVVWDTEKKVAESENASSPVWTITEVSKADIPVDVRAELLELCVRTWR